MEAGDWRSEAAGGAIENSAPALQDPQGILETFHSTPSNRPAEISSSRTNLSGFKNSHGETSLSKKAIEPRLTCGSADIDASPQMRAGAERDTATASKGKKPRLEPMALALSSSGSNRVFRSENHGSSSSPRKRAMKLRAIEEINWRLSILEVEKTTIKEAFFEAVHDRKSLIDEIYQQFQKIDSSLAVTSSLTGQTYPDSLPSTTSEELEEERTGIGLSQLLGQNSNPFVLRKEVETIISDVAGTRSKQYIILRDRGVKSL